MKKMMTSEEKHILLKDLCARLPYGVIVDNPNPSGGAWDEVINIDTSTKTVTLLYNGRVFSIDYVKPYLRPMSSMTEEELIELNKIDTVPSVYSSRHLTYHLDAEIVDYLVAHHFDFRGLIPMGLALEAPEGMYKDKEEE